MRKLYSISITFSIILLSLHSEASDFVISPQIFSGFTYIDYRQEAGFFSGTTFDEYEVSGILPFVGGGLRLSYDPFFLSVRGQETFEGEDSDKLTVAYLGRGQTARLDSRFRRSDITALLGYNLTSTELLGKSTFTIFTGYKYAHAEIENDVTGQRNIPPSARIDLVRGPLDVDFTYHGPQAGIGYNFPISLLQGHVYFDSAFTYYMATINLDFRPSRESPIFPSLNGSADATSVGYYFRVGWLGRLYRDFNYTLSFDNSKSEFDSDGNVSDFSETEYRFHAGLSYNINTDSLFGFADGL